MNTRLASVLCATLALAACKKSEKSGPVVAEVGDEKITAEEVRQRLNETSPFLRARYSTVERKKEFLENMVRNELLAQEAVRQGYDKSPTVREQAKRAMIQELIKHQLDSKLSGADIADDELKRFYDAHLDDFVKPERARVFHILLPAKDAKERAEARKNGLVSSRRCLRSSAVMVSSPTLATTFFGSDLQAVRPSRLQKRRLLIFIRLVLCERAEIPDETALGKLLVHGTAPQLLEERAGALQHGAVDACDELHPGSEAILPPTFGHKLGQPGRIEGGLGPELQHEPTGSALEAAHAQCAQLILERHHFHQRIHFLRRLTALIAQLALHLVEGLLGGGARQPLVEEEP